MLAASVSGAAAASLQHAASVLSVRAVTTSLLASKRHCHSVHHLFQFVMHWALWK
jgi:hypothetical protein